MANFFLPHTRRPRFYTRSDYFWINNKSATSFVLLSAETLFDCCFCAYFDFWSNNSLAKFKRKLVDRKEEAFYNLLEKLVKVPSTNQHQHRRKRLRFVPGKAPRLKEWQSLRAHFPFPNSPIGLIQYKDILCLNNKIDGCIFRFCVK